MATAELVLHKGGREVTLEELQRVPCPPPEGRWRPVPHHEVLSYALDGLQSASYEVEKMKLGLARDNQRFWGTLVLKSTVAPGTNMAIAVASSLDKSTSLRWAYGHRVARPCLNQAICWNIRASPTPKGTGRGRSAGKAGVDVTPESSETTRLTF